MRWMASAALCFLLSLAGLAEDQQAIELQLRQTLERKLLTLRTPYASDKLKFDSQGKLIGTSAVLPWTTHGLLFVTSLKIVKNSLEIEGRRAILVLDVGNQKGVSPVASTRKIHIRVELPQPLVKTQVNQSLLSVFVSDDVDKHFSEYWKPLVDLNADLKQFVKNNQPDGLIATLGEGRSVYCCVIPDQVKAPSVIFDPEPQYPDGARTQRKQGPVVLDLVINERGFPEIIRVRRSFGEDFDISAAETVSQWRFQPAVRGDKPVSVYINVEVDFRP